MIDLLTSVRFISVAFRLVAILLILVFVFPRMIEEFHTRDRYTLYRVSLPILIFLHLLSTSVIAYYNFCSALACTTTWEHIQETTTLVSGLSAVLTAVTWVIMYHRKWGDKV